MLLWCSLSESVTENIIRLFSLVILVFCLTLHILGNSSGSILNWALCALNWEEFAVFGRPFVKRFALCYRTAVCLSVCDVGVLWPNGWMDQDETWHGGRPRPWPRCVRSGPSCPLPKGHSSPLLLCGPCLLWPNGRPSQLLLSSCSSGLRRFGAVCLVLLRPTSSCGFQADRLCFPPCASDSAFCWLLCIFINAIYLLMYVNSDHICKSTLWTNHSSCFRPESGNK